MVLGRLFGFIGNTIKHSVIGLICFIIIIIVVLTIFWRKFRGISKFEPSPGSSALVSTTPPIEPVDADVDIDIHGDEEQKFMPYLNSEIDEAHAVTEDMILANDESSRTISGMTLEETGIPNHTGAEFNRRMDGGFGSIGVIFEKTKNGNIY